MRLRLSQHDLAIVQAVHDGQTFYLYMFFVHDLASALEGFLDDEAHTLNGRSALFAEIHHALGCVSKSQEVVNKQNMVVRTEEVAADAHRIVAVLGERVNHGSQHVLHSLGLFLLDEHHGQMHQIAHKDSRCDAAGFDGDNFVDGAVLEPGHEFFGDFIHQRGVHLMIDEAVHFQDASGIALSVLKDAFFQ